MKAGLLLAALSIGAYFLIAATIGFAGPPAQWAAYGEPPAAGWVAQPICFWTTLSFVIAGLASLRRSEASRPLLRALALLIVWMGPASMLEHGTLTTTWGWFDASAIHWFAIFVIGYLGMRIADIQIGAGSFLAIQIAIWTVLGIFTWRDETIRQPVTAVLLTGVGVAMVTALIRLKAARQAWPWFAGLVGAFAAGGVFLALGAVGRAAAPWGHGAWHLFSAVAMFLTFRFLGSIGP